MCRSLKYISNFMLSIPGSKNGSLQELKLAIDYGVMIALPFSRLLVSVKVHFQRLRGKLG